MALDSKQQAVAEQAMTLVSPCISYFLDSYPCLRGVVSSDELRSAALFACASAARTYDPTRAGISAYFSRAILHELLKACRREIRSGSRSIYRISLAAIEARMDFRPEPKGAPVDLLGNVAAAFAKMSDEDRHWLQRHAVEGMSIREIARQEGITTRQAGKLLRAKMARLRKAATQRSYGR